MIFIGNEGKIHEKMKLEVLFLKGKRLGIASEKENFSDEELTKKTNIKM